MASIIETIKERLNPTAKNKFSFRSMVNGVSEQPAVVVKDQYDFVLYGEDNLYPSKLHDLKFASPIHASILKTKTKMMAGDGLLFNGATTKEESTNVYNGLPSTQKAEVDYLMKNKIGGVKLPQLLRQLSDDFQTYGAYAYKIIWNQSFTKISGIKYLKVENVRSGKLVDGKVSYYYYADDWTKIKGGNKPQSIDAYYEGNMAAYEQIVYKKIGTEDYYGITSYSGCINWIFTDMQMGIFHRANMENGMNPGLHFKFYKLPKDEVEEQAIIDGIKKQWKGAAKTGRELVTFSESKDLSIDIAPIETSNLDKQLQVVAQLCDQKILTGHQLTSPLLAGLSVPGQIGGNTELEVAWQIFDGLSIEADRSVLEEDVNLWFKTNNTGVVTKIDKFKPFNNDLAEKGNAVTSALAALSPLVANKVLESMTENEIRDLVGLPPITETPNTTPTTNG